MDLAVFGMRVGRLAEQVSAAEKRNAEKEALGREIKNQLAVMEKAQRFYKMYDFGQKYISEIAAKYKSARNQALEGNVENALDLAFPDENFKIKIQYETRGKQELASLKIGKVQADGEIKWGSPHCRSGDFAKQLISLCMVAEITIMLGSEMLLADEPLSNGDAISLAEIKDLFVGLSEQGLQTLFIEHEEEMYKGVDRREIILEKDRAKGIVKVISNQRESGNGDTDTTPEGDTVDRGGVFESDGAILLE